MSIKLAEGTAVAEIVASIGVIIGMIFVGFR
jgi:hypothetical protein